MTPTSDGNTTDNRIIPRLTRVETPPRRDDAVTAARREMKFTFGDGEIGRVQSVLEINATPIVFGINGAVSQVNSIYFDDDRLSSCRESINGVSKRTKVRLRWYDEPLARQTIYFELKHRRGHHIHKQRVPLRLEAPLEAMSYPHLIEQLLNLLDEEQGLWLRRRGQPVALVSYRRRHFRDPLSNARLTLDYDLVSYDQMGLARPGRRFPRDIRAMTVVEAKASGADENRVRALLHPLRPRLTRNSKYVQCCMSMGWRMIQD